jgi:[ribosomal protein S18]-alanine N-acetyltransferase
MREDHKSEDERPSGGASGGTDEGIEPASIEPMLHEDLVHVLEIERASFGDPWSRASFESELRADPTSYCRVIRIGGRIGGYMIAWFIEDEAHLANIAVAPWARRQGYAQAMIDHLLRETYLRGSRILVLEVRTSNAGAITLYERNGFVVGGVRKNYYRYPREDALVMVRSLRLQEEKKI